MKNIRKRYLINKNFQIRFAFFFLFQSCVVIFLTLAFFYHIHQKYSDQIYRLRYDNKVYSLLINSFTGTDLVSNTSTKQLPEYILFETSIFAVFLFAVILVPSTMASHRIAGPLYKLNKAMRDVSRGKYSKRVSFRKRDAFKDVEMSFNDMMSNLDYKKKTDLQDIDNMIQKIIFIIKKKSPQKEIKIDTQEIRDVLLKMKKRKRFNE
ncbi:MAG: hypothetical protein KAI43_06605 [Candidatus Aureabacteria bacterium]|nr:hypothetical protein [Candidatus Auribacterota bacterium]